MITGPGSSPTPDDATRALLTVAPGVMVRMATEPDQVTMMVQAPEEQSLLVSLSPDEADKLATTLLDASDEARGKAD